MDGARARSVATMVLGVMALEAIIVSRQSEGGWRGSSDKLTAGARTQKMCCHEPGPVRGCICFVHSMPW